MNKLLSYGFGMLLVCGGIFAGERVLPKGFKMPEPTLEIPKNGETLPPLGKAMHGKAKYANLCPSCGRDRSLCHIESMQAKKTGKGKVCDVYRDDFVVGESRPAACPVCRHKVNLPKRGQQYKNSDSDLCPHPNGNVRYMTEIALCPQCGFAAFQGDFFKGTSPEIRQWVQANLQSHMGKLLHQLLGKEAKISNEQLVSLFNLQKDIPDTLRCKNAFAIYSERRRQGDARVTAAGLARMAWMTAWANRRAVSEPFGEGVLLDGARHVLAAIKKADIADNEQEEGIRLLTSLYREKDRFDIMERQIMRIIQAGYYNRLGLNFWADGVLRQVLNETAKKYTNPGTDPWQKIKVAQGMAGAAREKTVNLARASLAEAARVRRVCLQSETEYLGMAVSLITEGLEKNQFPALEIPTYCYLVGDFERRRENHSRALFWLQAAAKMCGTGEVKLEHCAPDQIDLLKRYVRDRKINPPANPRQARDQKTVIALLPAVRQARKTADVQTMAPGAGKPAKNDVTLGK